MVTIDCPSSGEFQVAEETSLERFFKNIGISCEIQTGDPEFDKDFYILADSMEFASPFFQVSEKRQAIREIFRLGFNSVTHDGKVMEAKWSPFQLEEGFDPSIITQTVSHLTTLAKEMAVLPQSMMFLGKPAWKTKRLLAFAIPIALLIAGFASMATGLSWFLPLDSGRMFLDSLSYSLPLLVLSLWIAVRLIKGRSSSHKELILILILSLVAFPLSGFGPEVFLNGWLDSSTPTTHTVQVFNKYITRSKNSTNYHVVLDSWRKKGEVEKLEISSSLYRQITLKRTWLNVVTKPGKFGFEWLVGLGVAREPGSY